MIYDRLHNGQEDLKARTQDHLNVSKVKCIMRNKMMSERRTMISLKKIEDMLKEERRSVNRLSRRSVRRTRSKIVEDY